MSSLPPPPDAGADAPLLAAEEARLAIDGVVAVERFTATCRARVAVLSGDTAPLFAVLTGAGGRASLDPESTGATLAGGTLQVLGHNVASGAHLSIAGVAPLDPPLPPTWSVFDYVTWSARLGGAGGLRARALARVALAALGVAPLAARRLSTLEVLDRRLVVLAQAIVLTPPVLLVEDPLAGLGGAAAEALAAALRTALTGRAALVSASRLAPGSASAALARSADEVLLLHAGEVVRQGRYDENLEGARLVAVTVRGQAAALQARLRERGIELFGGPRRFAASLPEGASASDILAAAAAAEAPVVEIAPLTG